MIQHYFNTGATLIVANLELFQKFNTEQVMQDEIRILVDTSVARTVILPRITEFPVRNVRITIADVTGSASGNNITVLASTGSPNDGINGSPSYTISSNFAANRFEPLDNNDWFVINVGSGGGGAPLAVNMTYAQLIAAIGSSSLVTGQSILLTDYQTAYYLQYSGAAPSGIGGEQVNVGAVEPLLLKATSSNTISEFAESLTYPQDTILYSPVMADKNYDYAAAQGKGCITFRKDNSLNNSRDYDWRTILFRRWETVIGNGRFWSYTPVAGAAFQDSLGLGSNVQFATGISVKSILAINPLVTGSPYWLDNTIFNSRIVAVVSMSLAFGNTFTYYDDVLSSNMVEWNSNQTTKNVVVQNSIGINTFGDFFSNNIIQTLTPQNGLVGNSVGGGCSGNNIAEFYLNIGGSFDQNTCVTMVGNSSSRIALNTADTMYGNNVTIIQGNACSGGIGNNVGISIEDNFCPYITNNIVNDITANYNTQRIDGNVCDVIDDNTSNVTEISGNIGSEVGNCSNVGGITYNNFANALTNISGTGTVNSLVGNVLDQIVLNGDFSGSFNVAMANVTITAPIFDTNFTGKIIGKTLAPTANMQSGSPALVKFDFGLNEFVEEVLTSGVLTYSGAITS